MSVEASAQVWKLDLPRDQKFVLGAMADHADDYGVCYPSIARIAWKCGYQQARSVSEILQKLIEAGVLEIKEPATGRKSALYRIRWDRGKQLPEFDPQAFKSGARRGAENAPQGEAADYANSEPPKSLTGQGENDTKGAENAPHDVGVRKTHPNDSVGVRSDPRRGAFSDRRGAVATAPEPLTNNQRRAGARASESRAPASEEEITREAEIRKLNGLAHRIGIELKTQNEPIEHFRERVESAHTRWLADLANTMAADARRRESEAPAGATGQAA